MKSLITRFWLFTLFMVTNLSLVDGQDINFIYWPVTDFCPPAQIYFMDNSDVQVDSFAWYFDTVYVKGNIDYWDTNSLGPGVYEVTMKAYDDGGGSILDSMMLLGGSFLLSKFSLLDQLFIRVSFWSKTTSSLTFFVPSVNTAMESYPLSTNAFVSSSLTRNSDTPIFSSDLLN